MTKWKIILVVLTSYETLAFSNGWDIPLDPIPSAALPPTAEEMRDSFSPHNRGKFGPVQCPEKSDVFSLNIMADYEDSLKALKGTKDDMNVFKDMSKRFSNLEGSRNLSLGNEINKKSFLSYLEGFAKGKKFINLNFAGHGEVIQGKAYMILPGYFKCLNQTNASNANAVELCGDYLVTGQEVQSALSGSHVFGLMASCVSGNIIDDMPNFSMIAASEPNKDILDDFGGMIGNMPALKLEQNFKGSELAGRVNDLLKRNISCSESVSKNGQVSFADIPALIPSSKFAYDRPTGNNVRDAINSCFALKPSSRSCTSNNATGEKGTQSLDSAVE